MKRFIFLVTILAYANACIPDGSKTDSAVSCCSLTSHSVFNWTGTTADTTVYDNCGPAPSCWEYGEELGAGKVCCSGLVGHTMTLAGLGDVTYCDINTSPPTATTTTKSPTVKPTTKSPTVKPTTIKKK